MAALQMSHFKLLNHFLTFFFIGVSFINPALAFSQTSSFFQAKTVLKGSPYVSLPYPEITVNQLFRKTLSERANKTLNEGVDFYPYFEKLVHPTGICLMGTWKITENSDYSGYFKKGSKAFIVARASVALDQVKQGDYRAFGMAGKLYPTQNSLEFTSTANFFVIDDLSGTKSNYYTDVSMTNEPSTSFRLDLLWRMDLIFTVGAIFSMADSNPNFRPLYPISELKEYGEVKTPHWMMLKRAPGNFKMNAEDFRDELRLENYPNHELIYEIYVSDITRRPSLSAFWKKLGQIRYSDSVTSFACDHQLHFAHPKIK